MDSPQVATEERDATPLELPEPIAKPSYKSWRKKYRKIKGTYDGAMDDATTLFNSEHKALQIAQRIQEQNDQLLEILLEVNDSKQTSPPKRYNLDSPSLPPSKPSHLTPDSNAGLDFQPKTKSLKELESTVTHTDPDLVDQSDFPPDLRLEDGEWHGYLTPEQEESLITRLDSAVEQIDPVFKTHVLDVPPTELDSIKSAWPHQCSEETAKGDFSLDNPISVHNWLRVNHPEIFDGSGPKDKEKDSELGDGPKASARSSKGKSGREKVLSKQDIPFKDLDEEIDFDARLEEEGVSGPKNRRKNDDETYRPKGGHNRASKRKRDRDDIGPDSKSGKKVKKAEEEA